mgnify:FL=1|tara:strand:+ start:3058 stop:3201 length:144 start_codon:yes stop_codon:yes gene_type:complete
MQEKVDVALFNSINVSALSITFIGVEQVLTILVLLSALVYNIKKLTK